MSTITPASLMTLEAYAKYRKAHKPEDSKAGFAYSGPYTESLLVGMLAVRLQKRIEWDSAADHKAYDSL